MILLNIDEREDNVCFTLQEKATLDSPYYLFEFYSSENPEDKKYCTAPDTSDFTESYNRFSLKAISSGSPDTDNGEFLALLTDFWHYRVYEQVSELNLDFDNATGVVETGILRVEKARPSVIEIEHTNEIITIGN